MSELKIYHCGCGATLPLDDSIPIPELVVHIDHPGGLFEPSLMWSIDQAAQALRTAHHAATDSVIARLVGWLDKIVRRFTRP